MNNSDLPLPHPLCRIWIKPKRKLTFVSGSQKRKGDLPYVRTHHVKVTYYMKGLARETATQKLVNLRSLRSPTIADRMGALST